MLARFLPGRLKFGNIALLDAVVTHGPLAQAVHLGGHAPLTKLLPTSGESISTLMLTMVTQACMLISP